MKNLIAISGKIGSGKDTVGKIIQFLYEQTKGGLDGDKFEDMLEYWSDGLNREPHEPSWESTWQIKKFAGKLKQIVSILTGIPVERLEEEETKQSNLLPCWDNYQRIIEEFTGIEVNNRNFPKVPTTVRQFLQRVGTEAMRNVIHENVWVNALFADYKPYLNPNVLITHIKDRDGNITKLEPPSPQYSTDGKLPNWIITDLRFPNEYDAVKSREGIVIRVNRKTQKQIEHEKLAKDLGGVPYQHPSETALDNHQFDYTIDNNGTIEELVESVKQILIKKKII